jgi:predicted RNA-binding protein with PIN domain
MISMPFIIDGHNLIPKIPGLSLQAVDDEMQLIEMLQEYCRRSRKRVEVFFDNAPPGQPRVRSFINVTARFVATGQTADLAIQGKLKRLGREARNWAVVSSDQAVQAAARAARASVISAEIFARQLTDTLENPEQGSKAPDEALNPDEIDDWLKLFGADEGDE